MKPSTEPRTIRPAVDADIEGMRTLLNERGRVRIKMRTVRCLRNHRRIANAVRTLVHTVRFGHNGRA